MRQGLKTQQDRKYKLVTDQPTDGQTFKKSHFVATKVMSKPVVEINNILQYRKKNMNS